MPYSAEKQKLRRQIKVKVRKVLMKKELKNMFFSMVG
jgi:hypothetical protein